MILHTQLLSEFVLIRGNAWLIHSQWPETPNLLIWPSLPRNHNCKKERKQNMADRRIKEQLHTARRFWRFPLSLCPFVPLHLMGYETFAQNKPNPGAPGTTAISFIQRIYPNIPLRSAPKNKPNSNPNKLADAPVAGQSRFYPNCRSYPSSAPILPRRNTTPVPMPFPSVPGRHPTYDIRHTTYDLTSSPGRG